ncbi:MAG: PKD domain-containing protein, partial [Bacteroidota bacterium]
MRALNPLALCSLCYLFIAPALFAQPVADFTSNKTTGCAPFPLVVSFQDLSTGAPTSWLWDFGDGSGTSSLQNPTYTFSNPGCYDITLTATNGVGSNSITQTCYIEIFGQPLPDFTVDIAEGCAPLTVNLTDNTIANAPSITSWSYTLSNGATSTDPNPTFSFSTGPDTIGVVLQVTNSNGCLNTLVLPEVILVQEAPILDFAVDVNSACDAPLTVNFTNNTQENGANNIAYNWSFPGGSVPGGGNSFVGTPPPPVTYSSDGQFDVSLELVSQNGCADTLVISNMVGIGGVTAAFTASSTQVCLGDTITFTNTSLGGVTSLGWNFGENAGIDATGQVVEYVYSTPGQYAVTLQADNTDCGDTLTQTNFIEVLASPTAAFSPSQVLDCQPGNPITFTDQSVGASGWLWDFGDGSAGSVQQSPAHTFTSFGVFSVCLTITNPSGCVDSICTDITIAPPTINFSLDPDEGCAPLTVQLTDQSTSPVDPITGWDWDFGSPGAVPPTSTQQNPTVTYPDSGTYTIELIVTTNNGCTDTLTLNNAIEVGNPPNADFTWDKDTVCINEAITFSAIETNPTWEYLWDFQYAAPGLFAPMEDTTITIYPDTGLFAVALIINNNGCRDTMIKPDLIFVSPPLAQFSVSDSIICSLPANVVLTDNSLGPADVYEWQVNGQFYSNSANPPDLLINNTGAYLITQIITNSLSGCSDTFEVPIVAGNPVANFTSPDTFGCRPYDASFVNLAQNQVLVQWKFDITSLGTNSQAVSPTYTYPDTGVYTVRMIAIDAIGCRDTLIRQDYIEVIGPYAGFEAIPIGACPGDSIQYFDTTITTSASTPVAWSWDFDDGSPGSTLQNPFHTFATPGFYDITLVVTDSEGCTDSLTKVDYTRITFPNPQFLVNDSSTCEGNLLNFESYSNGAGLQYFWDFGDGNIDSVQNPTYAFSDTGYYEVTLVLTDINGCVDSLVQDSFIYIEPFTANFGGDPLLGICPPLSTQFEDSTTGNVAGWTWDFGDIFGGSTLQDPGHVYLAPGDYDVTLIATHEDGCQDTLVREDYVSVAGPNGIFVFDTTEICLGDTICVTAIADGAICAAFDFRDGFVDNLCGLSGVQDTITYCYAYTTPGDFSPVVILEDAQGCVFTLSSVDTLTVHGLPTTMIVPQDTAGCSPFSLTFSDSTVLADTTLGSWLWTFGDGDSAFTATPSHTYFGDTTYQVY